MLYNAISYIIWTLILSIISFILFGIDKRKANKMQERIKESMILGFTSIGGALGSFIGRIVFHHKSEKKYFSLVIYISLLFELIVLAGFITSIIMIK